MNCQKNAVVCEGYPERVVWRSGKQRAEQGKGDIIPFFPPSFRSLFLRKGGLLIPVHATTNAFERTHRHTDPSEAHAHHSP